MPVRDGGEQKHRDKDQQDRLHLSFAQLLRMGNLRRFELLRASYFILQQLPAVVALAGCSLVTAAATPGRATDASRRECADEWKHQSAEEDSGNNEALMPTHDRYTPTPTANSPKCPGISCDWWISRMGNFP